MALLSDADVGLAGAPQHLDDAAVGIAPTSTPTPAGRESLGVRNNNPGNLRSGPTGFQKFATLDEGIEASDANLAAYGSKHGINTLAGVIKRWAPPEDNNDTQSYIQRVAKATGLGPDQKIDLADAPTRKKLLGAMFDVESPGWRAHAKGFPQSTAQPAGEGGDSFDQDYTATNKLLAGILSGASHPDGLSDKDLGIGPNGWAPATDTTKNPPQPTSTWRQQVGAVADYLLSIPGAVASSALGVEAGILNRLHPGQTHGLNTGINTLAERMRERSGQAPLAAKDKLSADAITGESGYTGAHAQVTQEVNDYWQHGMVDHFLGAVGFGPAKDGTYNDTVVGHVTNSLGQLLVKGADAVSDATHGNINAQTLELTFQDMLNIAPLAVGKFVGTIGRRLLGKEIAEAASAGHQTLPPEAMDRAYDEYVKRTGNPGNKTRSQFAADFERNLWTKSADELEAEARAHDILTKGASKARVMLERFRNPVVGRKLDEIAEQRLATIKRIYGENPPDNVIQPPREAPPISERGRAQREAAGLPTARPETHTPLTAEELRARQESGMARAERGPVPERVVLSDRAHSTPPAKVERSSTARAQLTRMAANAADPLIRGLAARLGQQLKEDFPIHYVQMKEAPSTHYNPAGHFAVIRRNYWNSDVAHLHEIAHGLTANKIEYARANPGSEEAQLVDALRDLQKHAASNYKGTDSFAKYYLGKDPAGYGYDPVHEFVAGLYSGKGEFINHLRGLKIAGGSILSKAVDIIRRILGIPKTEENALTRAMGLADALADRELRTVTRDIHTDETLGSHLSFPEVETGVGELPEPEARLNDALAGDRDPTPHLVHAAQGVQRDWRRIALRGVAAAGAALILSQVDKDHPVEGAVIGMLWGASHFLPAARIPTLINGMTTDELLLTRDGNLRVNARRVKNIAEGMRRAVPDADRRAAIAHAVEANDLSGLSPAERTVANSYRAFTADFGNRAIDAGVLHDLVEHYVTHAVERSAEPRTRVQELMSGIFGDARGLSSGAGGTSRFAKVRKYRSFDELRTALAGSGLRLQSEDVADLVEIYGRSMARAIENKQLFDALKTGREQGSRRPFIMDAKHAPLNYVGVDTPQLRGMLVHPDLAPSLRMVVEAYRPSAATQGLLSASLAVKRLGTSLSFFHAQNLLNAFVGAGGGGRGVLGGAVKGLGEAAQLVAKGATGGRVHSAVDSVLSAFRQGSNDTIDELLRGGLTVEIDRPGEFDPQALTHVGALADHLLSKVGIKTRAGERMLSVPERLQQKVFDKITWDYLHTGLKLLVAQREFERAVGGLGDKINDPAARMNIARQVSSYVNDTFGGLNWLQVATETQSQLMRNLAFSAFSPRGRTLLQFLLFAPDWTISTFRSIYKALPGSGVAPLTKALHQRYVLRTGLFYATLLNGINMATSGHPIWDNKDKNLTRLEFRDGTSMQVAKHAEDAWQWLLSPRQTMLNKLNTPISEFLEQLQGVQYLTAQGRAPEITNREAHAAGKFSPLTFSSLSQPGVSAGDALKRGVESTLGMQTYGLTPAQKREASRQRRLASSRRRHNEDLRKRREQQ